MPTSDRQISGLHRSLHNWVRCRENERPINPAIRLWIVYSIANCLGTVMLARMLVWKILAREVAYTLLTSGAITLFLLLGCYSVCGWIHGRLGYEKSIPKAFILSAAMGVLFAVCGWMLNQLISPPLPIPYLFAIAFGLPIVVLAVCRVGGSKFADEMAPPNM